MTYWALGLSLLILTGCSSTNLADIVKAHAANPRAYCAIIIGGAYGGGAGGTIAAGSPDTGVEVTSSGCRIWGSNMSTVTVPSNSITIQPPATKP